MKVIIDETIDSIVDLTNCDEYMVVVSDSRNFRYNIFQITKLIEKQKKTSRAKSNYRMDARELQRNTLEQSRG